MAGPLLMNVLSAIASAPAVLIALPAFATLLRRTALDKVRLPLLFMPPPPPAVVPFWIARPVMPTVVEIGIVITVPMLLPSRIVAPDPAPASVTFLLTIRFSL